MVLSFFFQNVHFNMEDSITKELQTFLKKETAVKYEKLGFKWIIGDHFYWLELVSTED